MRRMRINGVEEEVAVTTVAELLVTRGIDPATRFLAVAVNGAVVRRPATPEPPPLDALSQSHARVPQEQKFPLALFRERGLENAVMAARPAKCAGLGMTCLWNANLKPRAPKPGVPQG